MQKSVAKNYFYNICYQILIILLPLIATPYLSRVLGPDGVGMFGYTNSITQYFVLFGCIGLNLYGQREIAYHQDDVLQKSCTFWELLCIRLVSVSLCIVLFVLTVCQSEKYGPLFLVEIFELLSAAIDISWFFQGLEEFKKIVIRNAAVKIIGLACIFLFVNESAHVLRYALIYSATLFLGNFSLWIMIPKYIQKVAVNSLSPKRHMRPALLLFIPQIATNIYNLLDKSMIGFLTKDDAQVAFYEQAQKIVKISLALPASLGTVMLPRVSSLFSSNEIEKVNASINKSMRFMSMLSIPLCLGLIGISKDFVPWFYGDGYQEVIPNMRILAFIIILVSFSNVMGIQYLLPVGRQKDYTKSVLCGTFLNVIFNFILIPSLFSIGAAIGSVIAEAGVTLVQVYTLRKQFRFGRIIRDAWKYLAAAVVMFIWIMFISSIFHKASFLVSVAEIISGALVYSAAVIILKDELVMETLQRFAGRIKNRQGRIT